METLRLVPLVLPKNESAKSGEVTRVGRYQLAFELASGGMATVYLARTEGPAGFDKVVALKRIHPHLAKEKAFIDMFLDEARIASRISHPNVCSVFDFGEADGSFFIAMEYVMGETVSRLIRRLRTEKEHYKDPRLPGLAAKIIASACDGLHAAHELKGDSGELLQVVHRDVSPQNLFLAYDGTVRVVDFGIARAAGRLHETRTGTVKGKLAYMPPEQARKLAVDRRADVWALGVVLWEILCAKRLFKRANDVETILAVINDPIPAPSEVRKTVPEELDRIVMKALARDRDDRYATAREMGRELHRFLGTLDEPVTNGDLADWMDELFPVEKKQRLELIAEARRTRSGAVPQLVDIAEERSESEVRPIISDTDVKSDVVTDGKTSRIVDTPSVAFDDGLATDEVPNADEPSTVDEDAPPPIAQPAAAVPEPIDAALIAPGPNKKLIALGLGVAALLLIGIVALSWGGEEPEVADAESTDVAESEAERLAAEDEGASATESEQETGSVFDPEPEDESGTEAETEAESEASEDDDPVFGQAAETETEAETDTPEPDPRPTHRPSMRWQRPSSQMSNSHAVGDVNISTPGGWADVYLDGHKLGRAPGRLTVPAGRTVLILRPFGGSESRRVSVNVPEGATRRVIVDLN